jgi:uncharacterized membrane protein
MKLDKKDWIVLGIILTVCFILRLVFALNSQMTADEGVYAVRAIDIVKHQSISTVDQAPVWFYITDFSFNIFGTTDFALRLLPILASVGITMLIFLFCAQFYNKKVGFVAAGLFTLSNFALQQTSEMNLAMTFFTLFSLYCFVLAFKYGTTKASMWYLTAAFFLASVAVAIKTTAVLIFPAYLVFLILHRNKLQYFKKATTLKLGAVALAATIPIIPIILYNYLLNKYAGTYDILVTEFLHGGLVGTAYEGLAGPVIKLSHLLPYTGGFVSQLIRYDIILLALFVIGLYVARKMKYFTLILAVFGAQFLIIALSTSTLKHYVSAIVMMSIIAGYALIEIYRYLAEKEVLHTTIIIAFTVLLCVQLISYHEYLQPSPRSQVRTYIHDEIPEDAIVVMDAAIYNNFALWLGNDRTVLENYDFFKMLRMYNQSRNVVMKKIYYISCSSGDCGWGAGKTNDGMKQMDSFLRSQIASPPIRTIGSDNSVEEYQIFVAQANLPVEIARDAYMTNNFYMHNLRWRYAPGSIDGFTPQGSDATLQSIGFVILLLVSTVALVALFVPYALLVYENK